MQEGVTRLDVLGGVLRANNVIPDAADSERDDDGDDDESDDFETVHENILCDDPVLALRVLKCLFKDSVHLALVHEGPKTRESSQPQQFCNAGSTT